MKCIIFVRVSTDRQSYDEQTIRLRNMAESDGYSSENQLLIEYKESGIRLKEEERLGLNEMKELISADSSINAVYAFEISRIARSKKVLFSIEEFLVERHIQLIIAEPFIRLLNPDFSINDAAEFAFTMYAQYAESEMRLKQERFRNGRERSRKLGRWHGGRCLFGFKIVDKKMVPDENTAHIVRRCFQMYASGSSQEYISKYLAEFGVNRKGHNLSVMLRNRKYVDLIGQELFDSVQAAKTSRKSVPKYRIYSPGERLIVCPYCSKHYVHITNSYVCLGRLGEYKNCKEGFSISDKYVDAFLIMFAKYTYASRLAVEKKDDEERLRNMLDELPVKIEAQNRIRRKLENKKSRVIEVYTDGSIDRSEFDRRLRLIEKQLKQSDDASSELIRQQTAIRTSLDDILQGKRTVDATLDALNASSKRDIYEIVHQEVQEVLAYRDGRYKMLKFVMKAGFSNLVRFSGQGLTFKAEMLAGDAWLDYTDMSKFT